MLDQIRADLAIIRERDPAARGWLEILFCYRLSRHQPAPAQPSPLDLTAAPEAGGPQPEPTGPWTHRH